MMPSNEYPLPKEVADAMMSGSSALSLRAAELQKAMAALPDTYCEALALVVEQNFREAAILADFASRHGQVRRRRVI